MRFLIDMNLSPLWVPFIEAAGHQGSIITESLCCRLRVEAMPTFVPDRNGLLLDDLIRATVVPRARGSRSSQISLDGRHDRRHVVLHCPVYDNGVDEKVAMRDAVAHPPHQRPGVAEHPIPRGIVQAGKRLQPGGQPHADSIDQS